MRTRAEILAYLVSRFRNAEVNGDSGSPPGWDGDRGIRWIGIRFAPGDTSYVGITQEAEDHPQNLGQQLEERIDEIAPGSGATILLHDRSTDARYSL